MPGSAYVANKETERETVRQWLDSFDKAGHLQAHASQCQCVNPQLQNSAGQIRRWDLALVIDSEDLNTIAQVRPPLPFLPSLTSFLPLR